MAIPNNYIDKITDHDTGESRIISPAADKVRVENDNFEGNDLDEVLDEVAAALEEGGGGYEPPAGGIPKSDLAQGVQDSLDAADSAYQKPAGGIPYTDMSQAVQDALAEAESAVQPEDLPSFPSNIVQSVSINGGSPETPDQDGNVDLNVPAGAQGQKGDKGDTVVIGDEEEFLIVNDDTTGGSSDAWSAEMGKRISGREKADRARIDAIVAILKKSAFTEDVSAAIEALDEMSPTSQYQTDSISLDKTEYLFNGTGGTLTLTAYTDPAGREVTWSSSDSTKVSVSSSGVVTAVAEGTATITATSNGKTATCVITVSAFSVESISIDQSDITSNGETQGATHNLSATTTPEGGTVKWSSSNTSVATVGQYTGVVTIVGNGTTTITATDLTETVSDSITVTVSNIVVMHTVSVGTLTNVSLAMVDGSSNTIEDGDTIAEGSSLTLTFTPTTGEIDTVTVLMGGVSQTAVDGANNTKVVTIASVTADVSVTASASVSALTASLPSGLQVYSCDTLGYVKSKLTVEYNGDEVDPEDYTLSGTIAEGSNTLTVTYGNKSTTVSFNALAGVFSMYWLPDGGSSVDTNPERGIMKGKATDNSSNSKRCSYPWLDKACTNGKYTFIADYTYTRPSSMQEWQDPNLQGMWFGLQFMTQSEQNTANSNGGIYNNTMATYDSGWKKPGAEVSFSSTNIVCMRLSAKYDPLNSNGPTIPSDLVIERFVLIEVVEQQS